MFFSQKIALPQPGWKVLEAGPGATPHPRSDAFLELRYPGASTKLRQRGNVEDVPRFGNDVHINIMKYTEKERTLYFAKKAELFDSSLRPIRDLLRSSLDKGRSELIDCNKEVFFQGVEFSSPFSVTNKPVLSVYLEDRAEWCAENFP